MKYLKTFEYFDSPEIKDIVSDQDFKDLTNVNPEWKNKFQNGLYAGKGSCRLNDEIYKSNMPGGTEKYGLLEKLYQKIINKIPDFKNFEVDSDVNYRGNRLESFGLHLSKKDKLVGTRFDSKVEMWITYHIMSDNTFNYKKGKIKLLFVCGLRPSDKLRSLFGDPKGDETEQDLNQSFKDMIKTDTPSVEFKEKEFDNFLDKIQTELYGHPDKEDEFQHTNLQVYNKNLTIDSFLKTIPKIKKNYNFFKKYVYNKYDLSI